MTSFERARDAILEHVTVLGKETLALLPATGRVLAEDVVAPWDLPAWNNSAMDGYAVHAEDAARLVTLPLSGYVPAGDPCPRALARGTAVKILTGAPLPQGADAVVPYEEAQERDGHVVLADPVQSGAHVRHKGEDFRAGETVVEAGAILGATEICVLASYSITTVPVVRRPRVAILSTGDELAAPGERLSPGMIYDSNSLAVAAAVMQTGAQPTILGIARDDRAALGALLREGLRSDALITTAGVSAGDRDLVRDALGDLGASEIFWKVGVKPGRPTAFAVSNGTPIFSLPGNPVSALLSFEQFVRPALLKMMGHREVVRPLSRAVLKDAIQKRPGRVSLVRVRLERREGTLLAFSAGRQETGMQKTSLRSDGIAVIPAAWGTIEPGTVVEVQVLRTRGDPAAAQGRH